MEDSKTKAAGQYPGAAIDKADSENVTPEEVKAETKELNNNPRDNDLDEQTPVRPIESF